MIDGGINRVILATDGDFNVGVTNNEALVDMVEREREAGITLTTLGFGTGNYNEAMMEQIADHGNGNYAYIDSPREAQKVLDEELASTLFTIAHDVKIQVEFNPAYVSEYRLIGYENRALREEDFDNDAVDAGEIGAGHQVTALYEIVPAGQPRLAARPALSTPTGARPRAATRQRRARLPAAALQAARRGPVAADRAAGRRRPDRAARGAPAGDTAFAAAVAAYGQLLRGDTNMGRFTFADARRAGRSAARGGNYWRREFVGLTELAERQRFAGGGQIGLRRSGPASSCTAPLRFRLRALAVIGDRLGHEVEPRIVEGVEVERRVEPPVDLGRGADIDAAARRRSGSRSSRCRSGSGSSPARASAPPSPSGSLTVRAPCLRQKPHWQARGASGLSVSNSKRIAPQWHRPAWLIGPRPERRASARADRATRGPARRAAGS